MRNNNTFFMIFLFIMIAAVTKINMFFFVAMFFVVRMMMGSKKKNQPQDRYERRRASQPQRPRTERRQEPRPTFKKRDNPFKKSGIRKYKEYDLEDAIIDFNKGLEIEPNDLALHFNIACAYSLTEQKEKAYHHIKKCVSLGFKDFEKIQSHDDLAFVRIQPEYDDFKKSGFTKVPSDGDPSTGSEPEEEVKDDVLLSQLNKLAELRKKGLLSEQEFAFERKKLLSR